MRRFAVFALVIVLSTGCLSTAVLAAAARDSGESSWWAAWAVLSGGSLVIIAAIGSYRNRIRVADKVPVSSALELSQKGKQSVQSLGQTLGALFVLAVCYGAGGFVAA